MTDHTSNTTHDCGDLDHLCPGCGARLLPSGFCHACELKKAKERPPELTAVDLANQAHVRRYLARIGYINTALELGFRPSRRSSQRQNRAGLG
jgi:hypothetical protein